MPDFISAWQLQKKLFVGNKITNKKLMAQHKKKEDVPNVCYCCKSLRSISASVQFLRSPSTGYNYVIGLNHCNSVWCCKICASRIIQKRVLGLKEYMIRNPFHFMVTETYTHDHGNDLAQFWEEIVAYRKKRASRGATLKKFQSYKNILLSYGIDRSIMGWDVTKGRNGWHLHCHSIYFSDNHIENIDEFEDRLRKNFINEFIDHFKKKRRNTKLNPEQKAIDRLFQRYLELTRRGVDLNYLSSIHLKCSKPVDVAAYIQKFGLDRYVRKYTVAEESIASARKKNNGAPWELSPVDTYEFFKATKGKKMITPFPRSLGKEINDLAEKKINEEFPEFVGQIPREKWEKIKNKAEILQEFVDKGVIRC